MPLNPSNAVDPASNLSPQGMGQSEFLQLLLAQLTNQDPTHPVDNTAFVAQMAQFSALAQTQQINQAVGQLLTLQTSSQGIGLLGKSVTAVLQNGVQVTGIVQKISFASDSAAQLTLHPTVGADLQITLDQINAVGAGL